MKLTLKVLAAVPLCILTYTVLIPVVAYQTGKAVVQSLKDSYVE